MATTNLGLVLLDPGQNQKEVSINANMTALDTALAAFVAANTGKLVGIDASGHAIPIGLGALLTITSSNLTLASQNPHLFIAGPTSGSAAPPTARAIVPSDLPQGPLVQTLTDAATIATDASLGSHCRVTLGGNRTLGNPTNGVDGQRMVWEIIQDGTGGRTLTPDTKFLFGSDITSWALSAGAGKRDLIGAIYNSGLDKWLVVSLIKGF